MIMYGSFRSVFNVEEDSTAPNKEVLNAGLHRALVQKHEIYKLIEKLDVRKAMRPDEVSCWTLNECKIQLTEPIWDVIKSSLTEGRVVREWKKAPRVPIYKRRKRTEPLNYKLVSLTSVVEEICEIVIK